MWLIQYTLNSLLTVICYYLRLKLKRINLSLKLDLKSRPNMRKQIMWNLLAIHKEIMDFDNNFWSIYLALIVTIIMLSLNLILFHTIFGGLQLIYRCLFFYVIAIFTTFLIFILMTASSISTEANETYKLLIKQYMNDKSLKSFEKFKVRIDSQYFSFKI